jgi:cardiolipin synthase (CMP-forming)
VTTTPPAPTDDTAPIAHEQPAEDEGADRILTIPNIISLVRLACIPWFVWLLFARHERAWAATLLAVLGATDWVDGYIARRFHQVSTLGKILDPVADRLLLAVGVGSLLIDGAVPWWVGALVVAREVLVSITTLIIAAAGASRIDVQWVGKAATFDLMIAFPLFLIGVSSVSFAEGARIVAWVFAIPGLILSYYSGATYIPLARRALRNGRAGRAARDVASRIG